MTRPVASVTWQNLLIGAIGASAVTAQQTIHSLLGAECRHLDAYSYGVVDVSGATGTVTITLKDAAGNILHDQLVPVSCVKTL